MKLNKTNLLPTVNDITWRKDKIIRQMQQDGLDAVVIFDPDNVYWLTNFANFVHERPFILMMDLTGTLTFLVPKIEVLHVKRRMIGEINIVEYFEFPALPGDEWKTHFANITQPYQSIGFEENAPYFVVQALGDKGKVSPIVEEARFTKSTYELERINYACDLANQCFEALLAEAKPGWGAMASNKTITDMFMQKIFSDDPKANFLATRVGVVVQSPKVSFDPHNYTNFTDMDMVEGGPHIGIINSVVNGYGTEVERTFFLGHLPEQCKKPYAAMMEARDIAFEMCRPGIDMHDVDTAVYECFARHGYAEYFIHRTGHSLGVTGHEGPFLARGYHRIIEPNMVFTIEPGIYIPGIGGFRHSDTVITTETGNINLTPIKDSIDELTLSCCPAK